MKYILFFLLLIPPLAYGQMTFSNVNFEFEDFALNVTDPVTTNVWSMNPSGFYTNRGETLRFYSFDNHTSYLNVRWLNHTDTFANFTITTPATANVRGNVSGTLLASVEIDQVSIPWSFTTLNIVDIDTGILVEYFFPDAPVVLPPAFNAIVLSLNSPTFDRLGGVFAVVCPTNSTLTGLLTNGTFICTDMGDFFP